MAISYLGSSQLDAHLSESSRQPHVAHHRAYHQVVFQGSLLHEMASANGHDLIASENAALFIRHNEAIAVTIKSQTNVRFLINHSSSQDFRVL